ncbi:branched-chain amino acid aminotransferase [Bacillus tuaregi]|uniref:branched-chain amino acid aminotransferase n=1 Tax=Bacillus tuaregi TaxID=1816695 RepID=UPI0008F9355C|nr:branched-chain amino acid aminotransferase [Bacillus tuaregi]
MLRKQIMLYVERLLAEKQSAEGEKYSVELYKEEKDYIERHRLLPEDSSVILIEKDPASRFQQVYIERSNKETEELLAEESTAFLDQPIGYFKQKLDEFMYLESPWFEVIGVDAISFEADSVFYHYDVMLGLKLPKKAENRIKAFLTTNLQQEDATFDLMFSANDGLWDLNFSLNNLMEYKEKWTIREAYHAIYELLFHLVEEIEEGS